MTQPNYADGGWVHRSKFIWEPDEVLLHVDPVCLVHGLHKSEHVCLYCCLCFRHLTPEECHVRKDGQREDVCNDCAIEEEEQLEERKHHGTGRRRESGSREEEKPDRRPKE